MDSEDHAGRILRAVDQVLAKRPVKDDHPLVDAETAICAWRQRMIRERDAGRWDAGRERGLGTLNGVLSLVMAVHFPLGEVRWEALDSVRAAVVALRAAEAAASDGSAA